MGGLVCVALFEVHSRLGESGEAKRRQRRPETQTDQAVKLLRQRMDAKNASPEIFSLLESLKLKTRCGQIKFCEAHRLKSWVRGRSLGEIYEQQGKKDEAASIYRQAAANEHFEAPAREEFEKKEMELAQ